MHKCQLKGNHLTYTYLQKILFGFLCVKGSGGTPQSQYEMYGLWGVEISSDTISIMFII